MGRKRCSEKARGVWCVDDDMRVWQGQAGGSEVGEGKACVCKMWHVCVRVCVGQEGVVAKRRKGRCAGMCRQQEGEGRE